MVDQCGGLHQHDRRRFLSTLSLLGAAPFVSSADAVAQALGGKAHRVDFHHHFFPPEYLEPLAEYNRRLNVAPGLQPPQKEWTAARTIEEMDKTQVATSILSISTPSVWFGSIEQSRRLARICNEFATKMSQDYPGRFGLFASVPMPDVEGTLKEIAYSLDQLKADGIGLMTSWNDKWPGDATYAPVWEELNRRRAIVYFHPTAPDCCGSLVPGLPVAMLEYPQDTARAVASLLFSGTLARYPNIRFIFSHGGAAVPVLAGRLDNAASRSPVLQKGVGPNGIYAELRKLYYDTANAMFPPTMAALLKLVPISQVLFGSDHPYVTVTQNVENMGKLELTAAQRRAIDRENAVKLLPRLSRT